MIDSLVLVMALVASQLSTQPEPTATPAPEQWQVQRYSNCDYAYAVQVPAGLHATVHAYDNHGFHIDLPGSPAQIWVVNSYNMAESNSVVEAAKWKLEVERSGKERWDAGLLRREKVGDLEAVRVTATFLRGSRPWCAEMVFIYRPPEPGIGGNILYDFRLETPAARYRELLPLFNRTLSGFQPLPLPRGRHACEDSPDE